MTAMESMTSAPVAATKAVTPTAHVASAAFCLTVTLQRHSGSPL